MTSFPPWKSRRRCKIAIDEHGEPRVMPYAELRLSFLVQE